MADNLKVNAKTKILTFKKKHNLLVDGVPQKNSDGNYEIFENIVDKDGHARFIEGDIEIDSYSGIEKSYGKWSLSGSHLLIVLAISIEAVSTPNQQRCCLINIPQWVLDKIYDITGDIVDSKSFVGYDVNFNNQSIIVNMLKQSNQLKLYYGNSVVMTSKKFFRLNFDLLIDNA